MYVYSYKTELYVRAFMIIILATLKLYIEKCYLHLFMIKTIIHNPFVVCMNKNNNHIDIEVHFYYSCVCLTIYVAT